MKIKKMLLFFVFLMVIGIVTMSVLYNKPHTDVAETKADVSINADNLLEDFQSDEFLANSKYLEQIIQVNGTISELAKEQGKGIVVLSSPGSFGGIRCHLSFTEHEKFHKLKKGQQISIKGVCTGYLMDVILIKCVITE